MGALDVRRGGRPAPARQAVRLTMLLHLRRRLAQDMFAFGDGAALNVAKHGWLIDDPALVRANFTKGHSGDADSPDAPTSS